MLVEHSSTNTSRRGSTDLRRPRQAPLSSSSRSEAPSDFFVGPAQLADRPAHGGNRHPRAAALFPQLAVALKGGFVVLFELLPQGASLPRGDQDGGRTSGGGLRSEIPGLPPSSEVALQSGHRDPEGAHHLRPWDASVYGVQHFQP